MREAQYGAPPIDLGLVDLTPTEMMFWLYCPIKVPGDPFFGSLPDNLFQFVPLVRAARSDCRDTIPGRHRWTDSYVYVTAKTLWVTPDNPGNRPGWHSDGFMTDDLNYIWSDRDGTYFWEPDALRDFTQDHELSLYEMNAAADAGPIKQYPDRHFLRLDQSVIHRVADICNPGIRTFVKISISRQKYDLVGNSVNHALRETEDWTYHERSKTRNHPSSAA